MIAALPPGVEGIVGDVATLRLGRQFDAVLLASHFVNDPVHGREFLATAAAHLAPDGVVIAETYPVGWDPAAGIGAETRLGETTIVLERATVRDGLLDAEVRYAAAGREWRQPFIARLLDEAGLRALLAEAGLGFDRWLARPGWFLARPGR